MQEPCSCGDWSQEDLQAWEDVCVSLGEAGATTCTAVVGTDGFCSCECVDNPCRGYELECNCGTVYVVYNSLGQPTGCACDCSGDDCPKTRGKRSIAYNMYCQAKTDPGEDGPGTPIAEISLPDSQSSSGSDSDSQS